MTKRKKRKRDPAKIIIGFLLNALIIILLGIIFGTIGVYIPTIKLQYGLYFDLAYVAAVTSAAILMAIANYLIIKGLGSDPRKKDDD